MDKAMSYREIAKETGLSLAKISEILKGLPKPLGKYQKETEGSAEQESQALPVVTRLISHRNVAKLYALALDEGHENMNSFVEQELLPWYQVKRDFEWKLRLKLKASEFAGYIEGCMLDSMELKALKRRLEEMGQTEKPQGSTGLTLTAKPGVNA
jgi:hypothetical protein